MSKTAVIYARFSSDRQREESIAGQLRICYEYAEKHGLSVIKEYIDRAKSARTANRSAFLQMIRDSAKHTFDVVLVYQLDRFSRSRYDSAIYKRKLQLNGVQVISAMENITPGLGGMMMESMLEMWAEYYSIDLSQKVSRGMLENILEGKWPGGQIIYGLALGSDQHLVIDEETNPILKHIIDMFLHGQREFQILKWLKNHGYIQSNGRPFRSGFLVRLLRNPLLMGTLRYNGVEYPNFVEPTITQEEFELIQKTLDGRKKKRPPRITSESYVLSGLLYCGQCGCSMVGTFGTSRSGARYYYYICSSKTNKRDKPKTRCHSKNLRRDVLETLVLESTIKILSSEQTIRYIAREAIKMQNADNGNKLAVDRIKSMRSDVSKKLQNSVQAIEAGVISETLAKNIPQYEAQLRDLKTELKREMNKRDDPVTEEFVAFYLSTLLPQKKYGEYQLSFFSTFIRRIIAHEDCIEIQYNYCKKINIPEQVLLPCSDMSVLVGGNGFEPSTPSMSTRYSNQLS